MSGPSDVHSYAVVALDIDGTVLTSAQEVTAELREALGRLAERGVRTVLCTGRRWRSTVPVLRELGHAHPMAVCCGGALVKEAESERTLFAEPMRRSTARLAARLFRENDLVPLLLYDRPLSGRELRVPAADRERAREMVYLCANDGAYELYDDPLPRGDAHPLTVYSVDVRDRIRAAEGPVVEGLGALGTVKVMAQERYGPRQVAIEVHDPRATKWNALRWLLERWSVPSGRVVAIGDDVNDIPMLEAAGLSFAMGNAVPEVKQAADRMTATNDEHGVTLSLREVYGL